MPVKERETYIRTYTDAPEAYDGFGTRTMVERAGCLCRHHKDPDPSKMVRLVETPEAHAESWQRPRYGSGLYITDSPEQWEQRVIDGYAINL